MSSIRVCSCGITSLEEKAVARQEIIRLTGLRGSEKSICPSEVARKSFPSTCWREHMPGVCTVGFELVREEKIHICQKGLIVQNPDEGKLVGPIRFKLKQDKKN